VPLGRSVRSYCPCMGHDSDALSEAADLDDAIQVVEALRGWYETCYVEAGPTFAESFARAAARRRLDASAEHRLPPIVWAPAGGAV
jgi:hypothetical protein